MPTPTPRMQNSWRTAPHSTAQSARPRQSRPWSRVAPAAVARAVKWPASTNSPCSRCRTTRWRVLTGWTSTAGSPTGRQSPIRWTCTSSRPAAAVVNRGREEWPAAVRAVAAPIPVIVMPDKIYPTARPVQPAMVIYFLFQVFFVFLNLKQSQLC